MRSVRVLTALWLAMTTTAVAAELVPVGSEFQVNSYTTNAQGYPAVAADAEGNFVVAWTSSLQDGYYDGIFAQRYDRAGRPLGTEFQVNSTDVGYQYWSALSMSRTGDFVVAWMSYNADGSDADIFARRYRNSGTPAGTEFRVNTDLDHPQYTPAVAVDGGGNFVVVWASESQDGDDAGIFGQLYDSSGARRGTEFQVNSFTSYSQSSPDVAADADGNFVVVWTSAGQDGSDDGIFARRYAADGLALGSEFRVNSYTPGRQSFPAIAGDPDGGFIITWESDAQEGSGGGTGIFGQRYARSGVARGTEFQVNTTFTSGNQAHAAIAVDASGDFLVAWQSPAPSQPGLTVRAQHFASTGEPLGTEFAVAADPVNHSHPAAATGGGGFVVVWEDDRRDGDASGIFGQRLAAAASPGCLGDCDGDRVVFVNELIKGVNIAIGMAPLTTCRAFDADDNGQVAINELVGAVRNALNGCAAD